MPLTWSALVALSCVVTSTQPSPAGAAPAAPTGAVVEQPAAPPAASAIPAKPRIAVLGVSAPALDRQVKDALEETLDTAVTQVAKADVIGPGDVRALLNLSAYQQVLGCDEARCITDAKDLLAVQRVVSGSVSRVGEKYVVDLRLIDLVNNTTLKKVTFESEGTVDKLVREATKAVPALFGYIGSVEVWNQPAEAEGFLDGRPLGKTPVDRVEIKEPGKHEITIVGPGVTPWKETLDVAPGTAARVRAQNRKLTDVEAERTLWDVTGTALVVAGAVGAAVSGTLYYLAWRSDQRLDRIDLRTAKQSEVDAITQDTFESLAGSVAAGTVGVVGLVGGAGALVVNPPRAILSAALENDAAE